MSTQTAETATSTIDYVAFITEALNAPGAVGNTYNRFRAGANGNGYSFMNQMWLFVQGVNEPAAPFGTWKDLGRNIIKGSKGKTVLHPVMVTRTEKDKVTGKETKRRFPVGFKPKATVFVLSDTEGPELVLPEVPEWDLDTAAQELGIERETFELLDGNIQGYSHEKDGKKLYALNPLAAYPLKTAAHEIGHLVLGHTSKDEHGHRGIQEFQAEAVAYLVLKELELIDWNPAESRNYIQTWLSGTNGEVTDAHIRQVFGAVDKILRAGRATGAEAQESNAA